MSAALTPVAPAGAGTAPAPGAVRDGGRGGRGERTWVPTTVLVATLLVLWEVAAVTVLAGSKAVPSVTDVVGDVAGDLDTYVRHVRTTVREAWPGWLWGNAIATALGAVAVTSLPVIALGPIFQVTLDGDAPRSALAGLAVFFTTLVGTIVGLRACDRASIDVIHALGGGRASVLRKVRVRAALPDYFAALKISAPAAVLGAIVGEFIGGSESGLGVALISARANADSARVWGIALVATAAAGLGYAAIALVGRLLTPWAPGASRGAR